MFRKTNCLQASPFYIFSVFIQYEKMHSLLIHFAAITFGRTNKIYDQRAYTHA